MNRTMTILSTALITGLIVVLAIYLTPLKNLNLIPPTTKDIDPAVFWKEYTAHPDKYVFVDVRQPNEYAAAHAKGAINMPIETLFPDHDLLPRHGKTIVLMCSGGDLSGVAYGYLEHQGFLNLLRIQGGLRNWFAEGLPVEGTNIPSAASTSSKVSSLGGCPKDIERA